jgi:cell division protein FtsN
VVILIGGTLALFVAVCVLGAVVLSRRRHGHAGGGEAHSNGHVRVQTPHEPEPDWRTAQERQDADRMERQPEPEAPPRMVELPDAGRPVRPARPVVLEDDDLDVPDFLK